MLILEQYGIRLIRIGKEDTEMIRKWRNQKFVSDNMAYKKHISRLAQWKWFRKINNKYNYYFLIETEGKKVGVINVKNYDPEKSCAEGGIFIGDHDYIGSLVPVLSTLCLLNFTFVRLGFKRSIIHILRNNSRAISYNKLIGYKLAEGQEDTEHQLYELSLENYLLYSEKLNRAAAAMFPESRELRFSGNISSLHIDEINRLFK